MTTKNTELGYGGINWMKLYDDDSFGKLPTATDIIIEDEDSADGLSENNDVEMPVVVTMSASYIGLPEKIITPFIK